MRFNYINSMMQRMNRAVGEAAEMTRILDEPRLVEDAPGAPELVVSEGHGVSAPRLQEHLDEFSRKYRHRRSDQMADLLAELARWPHVRLADIRGARGPLG
ncbi:MAG: hypothetical protein IJ781_14455, partial [Atopobiaceae bacterium]|nr:hypothetical protein [Atopobiaceae bacterium]